MDPRQDGSSAWSPQQRNGRLELQMLGAFELRIDGTPMRLQMSSQRLAAFLAVHPVSMLRAFVAGSLWADKDEPRAKANLRSALWRLRQEAPGLVDEQGDQLSLHARVSSDVARRMEWATRSLARETTTEDAEQWRLAGEELLPGWYDDWLTVERERVRQRTAQALEVVVLTLVRQGRHADAVEVGLRAVSLDPLRESSHRVLILAHLAQGNKNEALRQYRSLRDVLGEALGVEPSAEVTQLLTSVG